MLPKLEISQRCISCDNCKLLCPENAIFSDAGNYIIDRSSCILCQICIEVCPVDCIKIIEEEIHR